MRPALVILTMLLLGFSAASLAQWRVVEKVDAMTDEKTKRAVVTNAQGHSFSIYRLAPGGAVWGNFALSERSFDQLSTDKPPMFRVDKHEPQDLSKEKRLHDMGLGLPAYEWEPKWVNFLMWHGKEGQGRSASLIELMEGKVVVFRYHLFTGGYKDTDFTLNGAAQAIADALGITQKPDAQKQADSEEFRKAFIQEMNKCELGKGFKACSSRLKDCSDRAGGSAEAFKACAAK